MSMYKKIVRFSMSMILLVSSFGVSADPLKLYVTYPVGWQQREPLVRENMLTYEASQQTGGKIIQHLQITAIGIPADKPVPARESLKQLADQLRLVALRTAKESIIPVHSFQRAEGYYFSATDKNPKPGEFTQLIEGVIFNHGYLINFTLLTNDAQSEEAKAMIAALDNLSIR